MSKSLANLKDGSAKKHVRLIRRSASSHTHDSIRCRFPHHPSPSLARHHPLDVARHLALLLADRVPAHLAEPVVSITRTSSHSIAPRARAACTRRHARRFATDRRRTRTPHLRRRTPERDMGRARPARRFARDTAMCVPGRRLARVARATTEAEARGEAHSPYHFGGTHTVALCDGRVSLLESRPERVNHTSNS